MATWPDGGTLPRSQSNLHAVVAAESVGIEPSAGSVDNTAAWDTFVESLAAGLGVKVLFRDGDYYGNFELPNDGKQVWLEGVSQDKTSLVRYTSSSPTLEVSGAHAGTLTTARANRHIVSNMGVWGYGDGSDTTPVCRSYYSSNLRFMNVHFAGGAGSLLDMVEAWDSAFWGCRFDDSVDTSGTLPAIHLRNASVATTGFGHSDDNTNNIRFLDCWAENNYTGALWAEVGTHGSGNIWLVKWIGGKVESNEVSGTPAVYINGGIACDFVHTQVGLQDFRNGLSTPSDMVDIRNSRGCQIDFLASCSTAVACTRSAIRVAGGNDGNLYRVRGEFGAGPTVALADWGGTNTNEQPNLHYTFNEDAAALSSGSPSSTLSFVNYA
jgi:hypothetical protein